MSDTESVPKPTSQSTVRVSPKHWFCVAVSSSGDIFKGDAELPGSFIEVLSKSALAWVDYWTGDFAKEAPVAAARLGFSDMLISSIIDSPSNYQDLGTEMGLKLRSIQIRHFDVQPHPLLLLLKKNFILTIHPLAVDRRFARVRRYADTFLKKSPPDAPAEDKITMLLMRLIDENNDSNFEHLRQVEELGDELNRKLIDTTSPRDKLGLDIYHVKHALITYLNALWETVDVLHDLRYGDAEIISNNLGLLDKMSILAEDVNRQIGLSEHLSEVVASGLDVMQSIYNNQLQIVNNRLALVLTYLTIVGTAVLVPNTLATIFSSSAFNLESGDVWWYVTMLVVSTVAATWLAYWWVKKMGWMPKKPD